MHILLIDNGTKLLPELKKLLHGHRIKTVKADGLDTIKAKDFDLIVLSGSSQTPVLHNDVLYQAEIELIKHSEKPIIGICLGFELIAHAFSAHLKSIRKKTYGVVDIAMTGKDDIFDGLSKLRVFEAHRWVVKKLPRSLVELARSKDGIEAVKHKTRKIYGFQFHPEMFPAKTCGEEIFHNLLNGLNRHHD